MVLIQGRADSFQWTTMGLVALLDMWETTTQKEWRKYFWSIRTVAEI